METVLRNTFCKTMLSFAIAFLAACLPIITKAQTGYVINVEDGVVYLDLTNSQVKVDDELSVTVRGEIVTDPATGRRVRKTEEVGIRITKTFSRYSEAKPLDSSKLSLIRKEDKVVMKTPTFVLQNEPKYDPAKQQENGKIKVVVEDATVNDVVGVGHFGGYVADVLKERIMMIPNVTLLDKSYSAKPKYKLNIVLQKPDVVNEANGGSVTVGTFGNGAATVAQLKSTVNMSVNVVDVNTGEVMFSCAETGKASGRVSVESELFVLGYGGSAQVNKGVENYKNTLSGQAIQQASLKLGETLRQWFSGSISAKVVDNRDMGYADDYKQKMSVSGSKLYLGTMRVNKYNAKSVFMNDQTMYLKFEKARKTVKRSWMPATFLSIIGVGTAAGTAVALDMEPIAPILAAFAVPTAIGACWTWGMAKRGENKMRNIASEYNSRSSHASYYDRSKNNIELKISPTSIALTF